VGARSNIIAATKSGMAAAYNAAQRRAPLIAYTRAHRCAPSARLYLSFFCLPRLAYRSCTMYACARLAPRSYKTRRLCAPRANIGALAHRTARITPVASNAHVLLGIGRRRCCTSANRSVPATAAYARNRGERAAAPSRSGANRVTRVLRSTRARATVFFWFLAA